MPKEFYLKQHNCKMLRQILRDKTYDYSVTENNQPYYYNQHQYLYDICQNLRYTMADLLKIHCN